MMDRRQRAELDDYITGHGGEDQLRGAEAEERSVAIEKDPRAFHDLIARAFPRNENDRMVCAWCGKARGAVMALCRSDWLGLSSVERQDYMAMSMAARATWIVQHIPSARRGA